MAKSAAVVRRDLESLLREIEENRVGWGLLQNDIAFAVTFWAMIESGFEPDSEKNDVTDKGSFVLPENWKHQTRQIYKARFVLPPYSDNKVKLIAFPNEDILCVNLVVSNISRRNLNLKSLAIQSTDHVSRLEEPTLRHKFSRFNDFHVLLRDALIWPIRCSILTEHGVMNASLGGLSDEIKLKIIRNLTVGGILTLSQTCRDLNRICNDQGLWKTIYQDRYKGESELDCDSGSRKDPTDWKKLYKETYLFDANWEPERVSSEFPCGDFDLFGD